MPGCIYPASAAEVLGINPRMLNQVDIGGASPAGMIWRAAAAIHAGMCNAVLCIVARPEQGRRSEAAGDLGAARVRGALRKYRRELRLRDDRAIATCTSTAPRRSRWRKSRSISARARSRIRSRRSTTSALTIDDVLNSRMIVDPLHLYEIVSPCSGGSAVIVASPEVAQAREASAGLAAGRGRVLQSLVDHLCAVAYRLADQARGRRRVQDGGCRTARTSTWSVRTTATRSR